MKNVLLILAVFSTVLLMGCTSPSPSPATPTVVFQVMPKLDSAEIVAGSSTSLTFTLKSEVATSSTARVVFSHDKEITIEPLGKTSFEQFVKFPGREEFTTEIGGLESVSKNFQVNGSLLTGLSTDYSISVTLIDGSGTAHPAQNLTISVRK